jgi:RNA polymerase sigma-70 factor (ECF subfamily)
MYKSDHDSDEILVMQLQKGDKKALAKLVKNWHKRFCEKAYWMVKDKDVAKDIAQDSWTIIIKKIDNLKDPRQFKYWAYRIVCNNSMDWLRLQSRTRLNTIAYETEIESDHETYLENEQLKQTLLKGINDLPYLQSSVIRLFYLESYHLKEISELLEISIGTVKSRLFRAREKLKKVLNEKHYN